MARRIEQQHLDSAIETINHLIGTPARPYLVDGSGKSHHQPGCVHLDMAYGGIRVVQMRKCGGTADLSGRGSKRETHNFLSGMIRGIMLVQRREAGE